MNIMATKSATAAANFAGRVLVYGGRGALGAALVDYFRAKNIWVLSVDLQKNDAANSSFGVSDVFGWLQQEEFVLNGVEKELAGEKLDAVFCVAGGWAGGNVASEQFIKNAELMWQQSVCTSTVAARIGCKFLKPGGLLQFTGAAAAINGTPTMAGYGMAKAAVHQLVKSLGDCRSAGLPNDVVAFGLLPITLDTPMNRKWMPKADHSTWTPLDFIADKLFQWAFDADKSSTDRPKPGALLKLITKNGQTAIVEAN